MLAFVVAFTAMCIYVPDAVTRAVLGFGWLWVFILVVMFAVVMSGQRYTSWVRDMLTSLSNRRRTRISQVSTISV
jgi:hypothetical protein